MRFRQRHGVWHVRLIVDGSCVERSTHMTDRTAAEAVGARMQHDLAREAVRQVIYVLKPEAGDRIKIGRTTNLPRRMRQIRANSPARLELIAVLPGDHVLEGELHRRFDRLRITGEWFSADTELLAYIERARWGEFRERKQPPVPHVRRRGGIGEHSLRPSGSVVPRSRRRLVAHVRRRSADLREPRRLVCRRDVVEQERSDS